MRFASRMNALPPYVFAEASRRLAALEKRGIDIINLGPGSPDLPPPPQAVAALSEWAGRSDTHGYAGYCGIPALREAIAAYYARRFAVHLDPQHEVLVLIGSKEGIHHTSVAFLDAGDVALVPDPGYPTYVPAAAMVGGESYPFALRPDCAFLPVLEAIPADIARAAKLLWLNYPNNPTGAVASLEFFERAVGFARTHEVLLCHDNPYCDVTFDAYRAPSILEIPGSRDVALEFGSLSKTYNMAGWRVGYAVGNAEAVAALGRVKSNLDSGIFEPIQRAAVAALSSEAEWIRHRNLIYERRRDTISGFLSELGITAQRPKATLYIWGQIPGGERSIDFCQRILEETGIWMMPGSAFGERGEGYVRISITVSESRLQEAAQRVRSRGQS